MKNGSAVRNAAYASLTSGGTSAFYAVNPLTGKATSQGRFAASNQVVGIAIPINQG